MTLSLRTAKIDTSERKVNPMSKLISRRLRKVFGKRKEALPKGLEDLDNVDFYAITEYVIDDKKQTLIEFLPADLYELISKTNDRDELEDRIDEQEAFFQAELNKNYNIIETIKRDLSAEKYSHNSTKKENEELKLNYNKMVNYIAHCNLQNGVAMEKEKKSKESSTYRFKDKGINLNSRPMPGSAYGGKKG